jgi:hypothetical protein
MVLYELYPSVTFQYVLYSPLWTIPSVSSSYYCVPYCSTVFYTHIVSVVYKPSCTLLRDLRLGLLYRIQDFKPLSLYFTLPQALCKVSHILSNLSILN